MEVMEPPALIEDLAQHATIPLSKHSPRRYRPRSLLSSPPKDLGDTKAKGVTPAHPLFPSSSFLFASRFCSTAALAGRDPVAFVAWARAELPLRKARAMSFSFEIC